MEMYSTALSLLISRNWDTHIQRSDTHLSECDGEHQSEWKKGMNHHTFYPISSPTPTVFQGMQGKKIQTALSINFNLIF